MKWAKQKRRNPTYTEQLVWNEFRELNRVLPEGVFWQRQYIIGPYIADFACSRACLLLEVDGASHIGNEDEDRRRQFWLEHAGWEVLRIQNEVFTPELLFAFMRAVKAKTLFRLNKYNRA